MRVSLSRSDLKGTVVAPSSKSYTIRGLMCAALSWGRSQIVSPLSSDDTDAALGVLCEIGVAVDQKGGVWAVLGGNFQAPQSDLFCGDSAATLRFMTAICALVPGKCQLTVGPSLARRPVKPLVDALRQLGADATCTGDVAPVTVVGGRLKGGLTSLPGNISSQFVSALLLVAPLAEREVTIRLTTPLESRPYVLMTLECLEKFGIRVQANSALNEFRVVRQAYHSARYEVEGDWSSASYFLALGAVGEGVVVTNLNPASLQADRMILSFLRQMGATIEVNGSVVAVRKSPLKAINANLTDCIDLLSTLSVLAAVADGVSELTGIGRARIKESDRVAAVKEGLERMGVKVVEGRDSLKITGSRLKGAAIDSKGDHRIAMAFSILGALAGDTVITGAECVSKTFPEFWYILEKIGGKLRVDEQ